MTYPDGDYIEDTFDSWLAEKNLYVMYESEKLVGVGCISVESGQGWIEGVRIHPDFVRCGYATELKRYAEHLVSDKGGDVIRAFVNIHNVPSLNLSKKCGYEIGNVWNWYELCHYDIGRYEKRTVEKKPHSQYVDSWRLYDIKDDIHVTSIDDTIFTILPSKHFANTILVAILKANDLTGFASYMAEVVIPVVKAGVEIYESTHGWNAGVHIVSNMDEAMFRNNFKKIDSYHLVQKRL